MDDGDDFEIELVRDPIDDEIGKTWHFQFARLRDASWMPQEWKALQLIDRGQKSIDHALCSALVVGGNVAVNLIQVRLGGIG